MVNELRQWAQEISAPLRPPHLHYWILDVESATIQLEAGTQTPKDVSFHLERILRLRQVLQLRLPPHLPPREGESAGRRFVRELEVEKLIGPWAERSPNAQIPMLPEDIRRVRAMMGE
jgi:hypothetical protein